MTKGWENIFQVNESRRQTEVVLTADTTDFKSNLVIRDKGHRIVINSRIHQENIWF